MNMASSLDGARSFDSSRDTGTDESLVSRSPALRDGLNRIERVPPIDTTVLLTGETGTGKELVARARRTRFECSISARQHNSVRSPP